VSGVVRRASEQSVSLRRIAMPNRDADSSTIDELEVENLDGVFDRLIGQHDPRNGGVRDRSPAHARSDVESAFCKHDSRSAH
jgi:hypothetical protein